MSAPEARPEPAQGLKHSAWPVAARASRSRRQRGVTMVDALISLLLLSLGMLALARLQARTLAQGSEGGARQVAVQYADELLSAVVIDNANVACYTLPRTGTCNSTAAADLAARWKTRAEAALPSGAAGAVYATASQRMTVTLRWRGKDSAETRVVEMATDVR